MNRFATVSCFLVAGVLILASQTGFAQEEPLLERSRDILRFGIDSEVIELIDSLEDRGEERLDGELLQRFTESRNRALQTRILEHFEEREVEIAGEAVESILLTQEDLPASFLRTAVRYAARVAELDSPELLARYEEIARDDDLIAASVAIGAIGLHGSDESVELLMTLFDELRGDDLRGSVVRALGDTGSENAVELLERIVTDPYEDVSLRQYGAESLGKIGAESSLQALLVALSDENSLLRAYATAALGRYDSPEASEALSQGLRDSFWRVRVAALQGIAERGDAQSIEAVEYKAKRDPESPVRQEAIRTLGRIGSDESLSILREIAVGARHPQADRILAVDTLADLDLGSSLAILTEVIDDEWAVENSRLLDATAQALSQAEHASLAEVYSKLLTHPNFIIRVYAIRGIGRNGLGEFTDQLTTIADENSSGLLHTASVDALDRLGIQYEVQNDDTAE